MAGGYSTSNAKKKLIYSFHVIKNTIYSFTFFISASFLDNIESKYLSLLWYKDNGTF